MAQINFGGSVEEVVTREEFPLEKAREVLANETIVLAIFSQLVIFFLKSCVTPSPSKISLLIFMINNL